MNFLNIDFYFGYFQGLRSVSASDQDAWETTEEAVMDAFNVRIFETYKAFQATKANYLKNPHQVKDPTHLTMPGYMQLFWDFKNKGMTDKSAWICTENKLQVDFNIHMYPNFNTFKVAKFRYIKALRFRRPDITNVWKKNRSK